MANESYLTGSGKENLVDGTDQLAPLDWQPQRRQLKDLKPLEKNPFGKITQENRRRLEGKIQRLGVFEAATLDTQGVLLTFNKRHNLLMGMGRGDEYFNVLVPNRPLTQAEREEIILASNVNEGQWIQEILAEFDQDLVAGVGINMAALEAEIADAMKGLEAPPEETPEYPIVAEFSEKYNAIIIVSRNEIDFNYIREVLGLDKMKSYKATETGRSSVLDGQQFISKWKSK